MEPSIDDLRKNYKRYSDDQLIRIATTDASGLRPEAIQVMEEEIKSRGLSTDLLKGIEVQRKEITEGELLQYCELLRKQPCPICSSTSNKLNATMTGSVVSFIVMTNYEKKLLVACPDCLDKANKDAMIKSALLGWWGIPWGIVRTIQAIIFNNKMSSQTRLAESNDFLKGFVLGQIGTIEANKTNSERLQSLIKYLN